MGVGVIGASETRDCWKPRHEGALVALPRPGVKATNKAGRLGEVPIIS